MGIARIGKGITYIAALNALQFFVGIIFYNILSKSIEPEEIGLFSTLTFILVVFTTLAPLAIQFAATKYVAEYLGRGDTDKAAAVARTATRIVLLSSSAFFVVFLVVALVVGRIWTNIVSIEVLLAVIAGAGFFAALKIIYLGLIQGLQLFDRYAVANLSPMIASKFLGIFLVLAGMGLLGAVLGLLIGEGIGLVITFFLYRGELPSTKTQFDLNVLMKFSLPVLVMMLLATMQDWTGRILFLVISGNLEALGVFDLVIRAVTSLGIIGAVLDVIVFPTFSESYGKSGKKDLSGMLVKALRYLGFMYFPAAFGLAAISRTAMTALYQARLASEGTAPLMILAVFSILNAFTTILNSGLKSIGRTTAFVRISLTALVVDAIIVTVSSSVLGLYGAVIARATAIVVLFLLTLFVLRKELPFIMDREGLLKGLASGLFVVPPVLFIEYCLSFSNIFVKLGVEVIVAMVCYFFALLLFKALRKEDLNILRKIFPSRMGGIINMLERFCAR